MPFRTGLRRAATIVAGAAVVVLAISGCSDSRTVTVDVPEQVEAAFPAETQASLEAAVTFAMAATGSTGAVVGVWAPWSGSWVAGVGDASADDAFRVGNLTRPMTCDVLYQMVDAGTVSLDDEVREYVPSVAGLANVTLGMLCDGTSGLGSYGPVLGPEAVELPTRVWNPNELAAYGIVGYDPSTAGAAWRDSDTGYVLLGLALQNAAKTPAPTLLQQDVFGPLELESTSLPVGAAAPAGDPVLTGLLSQPGADGALNCAEPRDMTDLSASIGFTNSGVVSNITDVARYTQALAAGSLVPSGIDRFGSPQPIAADQPSWLTTDGGAVQAGSLIGQFGSIPGYITAAFADPATGMTVSVVLNNSAASDRVGAYLAWELAATVSKAPAASGRTAPDAGLPWTAQQYHDAIAASAVCPLPAS
ncbi:serine hydrolase [Microbacterium sp. cx-59]|uniref:serine hydrolase domain-containing protein n=1 Tax=Microbacterium sp. cx-59 TaxID=2891207 RepID=UPI001E2EE8F3|nr:serine hydrolase domain-containing protein [Microbacterium sp. cx-59]MCC4909481.1 beta-lactamase family protein [Microbacterium sp. cx-59]